jgi:hypothetical protein
VVPSEEMGALYPGDGSVGWHYILESSHDATKVNAASGCITQILTYPGP